MEAILLTDVEGLRARLSAVQARERAARADAARLRRELAASDRRLETQRLCVLGRALDAWATRDERVGVAARAWVSSYVSRETDRAALAGTPWDVSRPAAEPPPHG